MDVLKANQSTPEHLEPLRDAILATGPERWESFSFAPGESGGPALHLEDRASRFFAVRGENGQTNEPIFEEQYGLNEARTPSRHLVRVGLKLGAELSLPPDTVLTGTEVSTVFRELHGAILGHLSRTVES